MNERKSPDDSEQFIDEINEEFEFGDAEPEARPIHTSNNSGSNKKLLTSILLIGLLIIGTMGYRYYSNTKHPSAPENSEESSSKLKSLLSQNEIKETSANQPLPNSTSVPSHPTAVAASPNTEPNFNDIAQAFSSADHTPTVTPVSPPTVPKPQTAQEGNIHDLQKELFAPEKVATTTSSGSSPSSKDASPNAVGLSSKESEELSQNLNKLNHQIEYILNQIKYLDSYTRDVSDNLNKLNEAINTMDSRLSAVTNTTSSLSKDVGSVRNEIGQFRNVLQEDGLDLGATAPAPAVIKKKPEEKEGKITLEEPEYTVHAVIPGRAWLKSSKGQQIVTVAEGDTIGNYGKILVIDAANGVVLTSSGIAFR